MPIKAFGRDYKIVVAPEASDLERKFIGTVDHKASVITISNGMPPDLRSSVILHEIIHIVDASLNIGLDEDQVQRLEVGLFAALKDSGVVFNFPAA